MVWRTVPREAVGPRALFRVDADLNLWFWPAVVLVIALFSAVRHEGVAATRCITSPPPEQSLQLIASPPAALTNFENGLAAGAQFELHP